MLFHSITSWFQYDEPCRHCHEKNSLAGSLKLRKCHLTEAFEFFYDLCLQYALSFGRVNGQK